MARSTEFNSTHFVWKQLFRKYFRYARMTSLKISKFDFSTTISNIIAQFAPVNKGLHSALIRIQIFFRKYFRYAQMTSLKISKFNFTAAVDNIYAQFAPVNRELNSAYIMLQQLFWKYFLHARMTSLKFSKFNFSAALVILKRSLYKCIEEFFLHISRFNNFSKVLPVCANGVIKY